MIEILDPQTGELMDTDSVPGLAGVAALHDDQIYRLSALVAQIQEADDASASGRAGPFVWSTLDAHSASTLWQDLADWVGWLRGRYPLARQVPLCWWRHPELVEELTALWLAWREGYVEKGASLTTPADWHGRWLPEFLRRVGAGGWNIACEGEHKERVAGLYDERSVDDTDAFQEYVAADVTRRRITVTEEKEKAMIDDQAMQDALASEAARLLGDLPDSPVAFRDVYWVRGDEGWVQIEDEDTIAFLADADRRLRLADQAVDRSTDS